MRVDDDLDDGLYAAVDDDEVDVLLDIDGDDDMTLDRVILEIDRLLDSVDGDGVVCGMLDNNIVKLISNRCGVVTGNTYRDNVCTFRNTSGFAILSSVCLVNTLPVVGSRPR